MNLDRFISTHTPLWDRLAQTTKKINSDPTSLTFEEMSGFVQDHERAETHLSTAQAVYNDHNLNIKLATLVTASGQAMYREKLGGYASVKRWFAETYPAAFWAIGKWIALAFAVFFATVIGFAVWGHFDPELIDYFIPPQMQAEYINYDFVHYYSSDSSHVFFALVTTNNIQVGFNAFVLGLAGGFLSLLILFLNSQPLGLLIPLFAQAGKPEVFWIHILPHGLLELSAIIISAGCGMALGWSWIKPGLQSRAESFRKQASISITVMMGTALMFICAGTVEGFITGAELDWRIRVFVGVLLFVSYFAYVLILGYNAHKRGLVGLPHQAKRGQWTIEKQMTREEQLQAPNATNTAVPPSSIRTNQPL